MNFLQIILGFFISLIISAVIIYLATKLFGETEGFGTALFSALAGAIIFPLVSYFLGVGWIAALIAGIAWLIALRSLYNLDWLRAIIIAVVIWFFTAIVSLVLPTIATGPV